MLEWGVLSGMFLISIAAGTSRREHRGGTSREEGQNGKVRGLGIGFFVGMGRLAGNQGDSGHSAETINKESEAAARRP